MHSLRFKIFLPLDLQCRFSAFFLHFDIFIALATHKSVMRSVVIHKGLF